MPTPMMVQYLAIKERHKDCILFFRLGDFYEMFDDDARIASKILNVTLTARNKGTENEMAMCGIPYHAADGYIAKLTRSGRKVAICEQTTEPQPGEIVERQVIRIVTPGTTLDTAILNEKESNFLVSIDCKKGIYGLAVLDFSTGSFLVTEDQDINIIADEIISLRPSEILTTPSLDQQTDLINRISDISILQQFIPSAFREAKDRLAEFFKVHSVSTFGLDDYSAGLCAAANCLDYLQETQKSHLDHIRPIKKYDLHEGMLLDGSTVRNLELFYNNNTFSTEGSLIGVIDKTVTAMGGRLLRQHLRRPLTSAEIINTRLSAVELLTQSIDLRQKIGTSLKQTGDIERLMGRLGSNRTSPRDLLALRQTLEAFQELTPTLQEHSQFNYFAQNIPNIQTSLDLLKKSISEDAPAILSAGGGIKSGYNGELDELRAISFSGKDYLTQIQSREIARTKIASLKVKFNRIFGYYIEVSKANLNQVPADFQRTQTLVGAERFTTPELKEYEEKVLTAEEKIRTLEEKIFQQIRTDLLAHINDFFSIGAILANIDVCHSMAILALSNNYIKPEVSEGYDLEIGAGRHPVIELSLGNKPYIPNDGYFNTSNHQLMLLTGPNMAGKSSYLRQTALIVLLAQIGSYVPAKKAVIGAVDKIFTRVGASDNLAQGQSTFMVEMQEAANIVHNATQRSLIVLDELGRGTSTYDGVSIAWALVEYIHNQIKAKTIFATHYHELTELVAQLDYAQNYSVSVAEEKGELIFLRKIVSGPINKSYGIEVAKIAGLPKEVIVRAYEILQRLENEHQNLKPRQKQISFDESPKSESQVEIEISKLDLNDLTPNEAWQKLKNYYDSIHGKTN